MPRSASVPLPILHIAVATPVADGFDYLAGPDTPAQPLPGCRIKVPFGHRNAVGVLLECRQKSEIAASRLKHTHMFLDQKPILTPDLLELATWASRYYHHPLGEVLHAMLPAALRQGKPAKPQLMQRWRVTNKDNATTDLKRAAKQQQVYRLLASEVEGLNEDQLNQKLSNWRSAIRGLETKGLVEGGDDLVVGNTANYVSADAGIVLSSEQQQSIDQISAATDRFQTWLLDGVTGSGKTEVYLRLIQQALASGKQCLVLVPEIGLTPQLLDRFVSRLETQVLTWHSALTDHQRHQVWYAASSGQAGVIIGTRSAVFLPLNKPGLIIIDEEHDNSLKQQEGFRYHARDLAIVRAQQLSIPVILGSATPSLESLNNAQQNRYQLLQLRQRAGNAQLPRIALLDTHNAKNNQALSQNLLEAMATHLSQGTQVLLFLNRRGFAPLLLCTQCDWNSECPRCDTHMTMHQSDQRLRCHHCGHEQVQPRQCPACGADDLHPIGIGTEQLEQVLEKAFPENRILRIDRDSVRRKGVLQSHLEKARTGKVDILLGTQMLAKGHHFPNVTLVGILGIDQALFSADFRGPEFMAQLVTQVAGRAGRAERKGEVLIETRQPQHPLLRLLICDGYAKFAQAALNERQQAALPPYTYLILLRAESVSPQAALDFLHQLAQQVPQNKYTGMRLMGPMPAPMERRAGRFRAQLLLQSAQRQVLHLAVDEIRKLANQLPQRRKVRWSIDVDPMEML